MLAVPGSVTMLPNFIDGDGLVHAEDVGFRNTNDPDNKFYYVVCSKQNTENLKLRDTKDRVTCLLCLTGDSVV